MPKAPTTPIQHFSATRIRELAIIYQCTPRTLYRWLAIGIDIEDAEAVTEKILGPLSTIDPSGMIEHLSKTTTTTSTDEH